MPTESTKQVVFIGTRINKEHVSEIYDYIHKEKNQHDRRNEYGRPYSRNDYVIEALDYYAKKIGLHTSPHK